VSASISSAVAQQQSPSSDDAMKGIVARMRPQVVARQKYTQSAAEYQNCLAANPTNVSACEGLRHVMDVNAMLAGQTAAPDILRFSK
jgi:hypothetical protein